MNKFEYKAVNDRGEIVVEHMDASTTEEVFAALTSRGYNPINIKQASNLGDLAKIFDFSKLMPDFNKVKSRDTMLLFRQMSALFSAGIPLFETLVALEEQFAHEKLREIITKLKEEVAAGTTLSDALSQFPKVFSTLVVAMVAAGERSGTMEEVLKKISQYLEKENLFHQKISSAMRYPLILVGALVSAFIFAVLFILPTFKQVFAAFKSDLPLPTQVLLGINTIMTVYWLPMIIVLVLLYLLFKYYVATPIGKHNLDSLMLKIPILGPLITKLSLARFFTMLASTIGSGISVVSGLEITASTADNVVISDAILSIREKVVGGTALSESLRQFSLFPPAAIYMVSTGEKTGSLDTMLAKSAQYFDEETDYTISNLMTLLEPILIFVLGLGVLLLALGIFLPMWNMSKLYTG